MRLSLNILNATGISLGDIGSFLCGIGTLGLFIIGIITYSSIKQWQIQKRLEKKSNIAEKTLNKLDKFKSQILDWIKFSFMVYSKNSESNIKKYDDATDQEKRNLIKLYNKDRYEIKNYYKLGRQILEELYQTINHARRLKNSTIDTNFQKLSKLVESLLNLFSTINFEEIPNNKKIESLDLYNKIPNEIERLYLILHDQLTKNLNYEENT